MEERVTQGEALRIVKGWIGTPGGYLGDFSYNSLDEFLEFTCGVDAPDRATGRWAMSNESNARYLMRVLTTVKASDQAKILRGILDRYPVGSAVEAPGRAPCLGWSAWWSSWS